MDGLNDTLDEARSRQGAAARGSDHRGRRGLPHPRQTMVVRMLDEQATSEHRRMTIP
jgi:hypothetical protein